MRTFFPHSLSLVVGVMVASDADCGEEERKRGEKLIKIATIMVDSFSHLQKNKLVQKLWVQIMIPIRV
jgi:hypothetical protein